MVLRRFGSVLPATLVAGLVVALGGCTSGGNGYAAYPTQSGTSEDVIPAITAPALNASGQLLALPEVICDPASIVSSDLGLDAPIYRATADADFNEKGYIDPQYFNAVAWTADVGSVPYSGAKYATYMYGHYSTFREGAFNNLKNAVAGSVIHLTFPCRSDLVYEVVATDTVPKEELSSNELYSSSFDKPGWLVLTTCDTSGGTSWWGGGVHANDNLVVALAPVPVNAASAG